MIYSELNQQVEENMYKCVLNVGVDVNKEELYKALQYDRNQYDKGYSDAKGNMTEATPIGKNSMEKRDYT